MSHALALAIARMENLEGWSWFGAWRLQFGEEFAHFLGWGCPEPCWMVGNRQPEVHFFGRDGLHVFRFGSAPVPSSQRQKFCPNGRADSHQKGVGQNSTRIWTACFSHGFHLPGQAILAANWNDQSKYSKGAEGAEVT